MSRVVDFYTKLPKYACSSYLARLLHIYDMASPNGALGVVGFLMEVGANGCCTINS